MDFDAMLYRPLASGKEFENLIPKSTCKAVVTGEGDTDFSIPEMVKVVLEHSHQMERVANELKSIFHEKTINAIKNFCFHHLLH